MRATIALSRPEPCEPGSSGMGCISLTVRVAPIGSADDGAIDSGWDDVLAVDSYRAGKMQVARLTFAYA